MCPVSSQELRWPARTWAPRPPHQPQVRWFTLTRHLSGSRVNFNWQSNVKWYFILIIILHFYCRGFLCCKTGMLKLIDEIFISNSYLLQISVKGRHLHTWTQIHTSNTTLQYLNPTLQCFEQVLLLYFGAILLIKVKHCCPEMILFPHGLRCLLYFPSPWTQARRYQSRGCCGRLSDGESFHHSLFPFSRQIDRRTQLYNLK